MVNFDNKIPRDHLNFSSLFDFFQRKYFLAQGKVWVAPKWTHPFIIPRSIKRFPETPRGVVVKSKLSIRSGYTALRQLNPIIKKGSSSFYPLKALN